MALDERLKQRLLGGAVLVALVVIFVPMLIDEPVDSRVVSDHRIPLKPEDIEKPMPTILPPPPEASEAPAPVASKPPAAKPTERTTANAPKKQPEKTKQTQQSKRKPPAAWIIQVVSLTVEKNALQLVSDLRKADMPAQVQTVDVDGKRHYRVRVGPEVNHRTALKMAERIKGEFKLTPRVLQYSE
jgi:DedD protein